MKRSLPLFLLAACTCVSHLTGCSSSSSNGQPADSQPQQSDDNQAKQNSENTADTSCQQQNQQDETKSLVVYFSRVGNTDFPDGVDVQGSASLNEIDGRLVGNTQHIAELIAQDTGADLFLIQTKDKYPAIYEEVDAQGGQEQKSQIRPELESHLDTLDDYDVIYLGCPIWYYDMPMAVYSFLEEYDLSGKTIVPFVTSGGSGFTKTLDAIQELEPNASLIQDGFKTTHSRAGQVSQEEVSEWLGGLPTAG